LQDFNVPQPSPNLLRNNIDAAVQHLQALGPLAEPLSRAADLVARCFITGHKVLTCGNGGSAADAAHLATEWACRFVEDRPPYPAICLSEVASTVTATSNDYGYDEVFARQVWAFGQAGDVLIALSTSGRSPSIVAALKKAAAIGLDRVAFLGRDGGDAKGLATVELIVPSGVTARIQEAHALLYHTLCEMIEPSLRARPPI
jgi:D-sedoheptulose 7-phosphate isomerase